MVGVLLQQKLRRRQMLAAARALSLPPSGVLPALRLPAPADMCPASTARLSLRSTTCKFDNVCLDAATGQFEYYLDPAIVGGAPGPCPRRASVPQWVPSRDVRRTFLPLPALLATLLPPRPSHPACADLPVAHHQVNGAALDQFPEHLLNMGELGGRAVCCVPP